jgi:translocation and assembly module TamB
LNVKLPEFDLVLHDGALSAEFDRQQLLLKTLRFASGSGQVSGTGSATLVPGKLAARVDLTAEKLTVLARPDRLVVLSGQVGVTWDQRELRAQGRLTADQGVIELPREDKPQPSGDVVVLGTQPAPAREFRVQADLALDLGKNFVVRGRGLSTRLAGTLRAQLAPKRGITLTGSVRTAEGTYMAYGQKLDIQRGVLTFVGPVDNPSLDILAVRKTESVEVGVAVGGTALLPQVRLVSTPAMSDADKLAWLTLGHGLDQAGKNQTAVLQAAAMALLSRGNTDSQGTLASRFGLDELSLGTVSGTGEQVVSVGKRIASNFYLGFERGVTGAVSVIKITYDLSRRWSVQARAGSENAVDLFYTLGFR